MKLASEAVIFASKEAFLKDISIFITTNNKTYSYFLNNNELIENNILNSYNLFNLP